MLFMLMTPEFFKFILNYLSFKSLDKECSHMTLDFSLNEPVLLDLRCWSHVDQINVKFEMSGYNNTSIIWNDKWFIDLIHSPSFSWISSIVDAYNTHLVVCTLYHILTVCIWRCVENTLCQSRIMHYFYGI